MIPRVAMPAEGEQLLPAGEIPDFDLVGDEKAGGYPAAVRRIGHNAGALLRKHS